MGTDDLPIETILWHNGIIGIIYVYITIIFDGKSMISLIYHQHFYIPLILYPPFAFQQRSRGSPTSQATILPQPAVYGGGLLEIWPGY